jgi:hypothetical protein
MKKKIGIVTFWNSEENYGQILQCYALQKFLKTQKGGGYDIFLIRTETARGFFQKLKRWLPLLLGFHFCTIRRKIRGKFIFFVFRNINRKHPRYFEDFRNKYIISTEKIYTISELKRNPPFANIYICGSDQIWNVLGSAHGLLPLYFLDFGGNCKRISYAASFGGLYTSDIPDHIIKKIASYLKRFDAISVREPRAIDICAKAGRDDAVCVPDPTLLLSQAEYMEILKPFKLSGKKYLFIYFLWEKSSADIKKIYRFAHENNLDVVYVACQRNVNRGMNRVYPTIEQWLFLVKNAEYVVTDSFHGTVFSIKMNRKFYTILISSGWYQRNNERIYTLLDRYKLRHRCGDFSPSVLKEEICYESVNEMLYNDRKETEIWIKKCLCSV